MKLMKSSSSAGRNGCFPFLLVCLLELTSASIVDQSTTTFAGFNPSGLQTAVNGNQFARRAKEGGKEHGAYKHKYAEKLKCTENTTPMDNGGSKVTKKCIRQGVILGSNGIKPVSGSELTTNAVTWSPSANPSGSPMNAPTTAPTGAPTLMPTSGPTTGPTSAPTIAPTWGPTAAPTSTPTSGPTSASPTNNELLASALPNEDRGTKTSTSKTAVGALVGGVLGFVILATGAKAVETAWSRRATADTNEAEEMA